jgi:putative sterol carrier protein
MRDAAGQRAQASAIWHASAVQACATLPASKRSDPPIHPHLHRPEPAMPNFKYLSPEWAAEALRRLRAELSPEKMKHITSSMMTVYTHCPDGKMRAVYYVLKEGAFEQLTIAEGELPEAEFVIKGDYDTFAQISRAELKSRKALMSGKLELKGNLVKALSLAVVVDRLNEVLATIPTDY